MEPACLCTLEIFSVCSNVKHRYVLFASSVQWQREPSVPGRINGTMQNFPLSIYWVLSSILSILNTLFLYKYHKFPYPTTDPACNVAKTTLPLQTLCSLSIHLDFLFLLFPRLLFTPNSHYCGDDAYLVSFLSIFPINLSYVPVHGAALTA